MPHSASTHRPAAVVIGASATGLFAAAALAEFADVTIVERDELPDGPVLRRGVPQARHAHLLWSGGLNAFNELLPGVVNDAVARGARLIRFMGDGVSRAPNEVWFRRFVGNHHRMLLCSRALLDSVLRDHVLAQDHITVLQNTTALSLEGTATRITGLHARIGDDERLLSADLVVDASGRGSHTPQWLQDLGLPPAAERRVDAGLAYATRLFRAPGTAADTTFPLINVQANPAKAPGQGGVILPIENGQWIVTLAGTRGGEPTADPDAFIDFALSLGDPVIGELLKNAEPLGDISTTRSTANHRRYYEKAKAWPDGFVVLGDAMASYNPVYGHGLTVAAQCALAVRDVLRTTQFIGPGTSRKLQKAAARPVGVAWDLAVGQDAFYPGAADNPPTAMERFLARFVDRAVETGASNPRAMSVLLDVMSLEKPATRLFSWDMLGPMLFGPKRPPLQGPPLTEIERRTALS
ncbi:FAD-dependent monooxygenase [Streptomyces sp. ISL-22]|uniref:NAD(P)/FAD-dependent oxidoreductase n=1 Tax=unclassified Streptomyces TaxID=2593676 RepID=UPI001BEB7BA3|nr:MULTISPECIES: FAD-dependent monooxygenase [unclassified Streptomyces]MBT2421915.1 FAD-dependent monooxygenase [Streptomyces sp. ISL-24]MBT2433465.1 FAD-dependent monooxygenase [Streptomyces sp. ISL-22]